MSRTCPDCHGRLYLTRITGKTAEGEPIREKIDCHRIVCKARREAQKKLVIKARRKEDVAPSHTN